MTRRRVEGVAGFEDLFAIGVAKDQLAADDIAPVRALAAVIWQSLHERRRVDVLAEGREIHRVPVEIVGPIHDRTKLPTLRRAVPRNLRHLRRLLRLVAAHARRRNVPRHEVFDPSLGSATYALRVVRRRADSSRMP